MKKIRYAVMGYGNRGKGYTAYCLKHPEEYEVCAVIENNPKVKEVYDLDAPFFDNLDDFLNEKMELDIVCVATQDDQHMEHAIKLMENGYDLLLEKPISNKYENVLKIYEASIKYNRKVYVCHVLRYTKFYRTIKELLVANEIGKVINIQTQEDIGYWHFAHSYVRGPWAVKEESSPIILAKCCHDLDLICWFMDENCKTVNSMGSLSFFKKENKPAGASDHCTTCPVKENCVYEAMKIYPVHPWCNNYYMKLEPTLENIKENLPKSKFDRCVFDFNNNVCDHQSVIMQFESGAICTHTLSAFSQNVYRTIHLQGTMGEIWGTFDEYNDIVEIRKFDGTSKTIDTKKLVTEESAHGGGDAGLMHELYLVFNGEKSISITSIDQSVLSHKIAFKAEESRINNGKTLDIE